MQFAPLLQGKAELMRRKRSRSDESEGGWEGFGVYIVEDLLNMREEMVAANLEKHVEIVHVKLLLHWSN